MKRKTFGFMAIMPEEELPRFTAMNRLPKGTYLLETIGDGVVRVTVARTKPVENTSVKKKTA